MQNIRLETAWLALLLVCEAKKFQYAAYTVARARETRNA
jgi:hypothetical protein